MPTTRSSSRGRPVNAELTPTIMAAVLSLLAEDGYARLTTAAVAKRAGVSTATLYRRWPSKRDLLLAAAEQIADAEAADFDTGTTVGDLQALLAHKRRVLSGGVAATLSALMGEAAHDGELAAILRASVVDPARAHVTAILDRARARGEEVNVAPEAVTQLLLGTILARVALGDAQSDDLIPEDTATLLTRAVVGHVEPAAVAASPTPTRRRGPSGGPAR
ncbi:TetR/AcrR family transcriptional regulator [Salana multivorans]